MYSTCLFCQSSLGKNEVIEAFPIGRRLAFDSDKGRLWVVCRRCARWNLTPLEERWEAIEECERAFSGTRLRVSTDHVGLARLGEGLELIRIGQPQKPEFAAWRYGDQFGRRFRKSMIYFGVGGAAAIGNFASGSLFGPMLGITGASGILSAAYILTMGASLFQRVRVRGRVAIPGQRRPALVRESQLKKIRIMSSDGTWRIRMPMDGATLTGPDHGREVTLEGEAALRGAATILAVANHAGADQKRIQTAVKLVSELPDASQLFVNSTSRTWRIDPQRNQWVLADTRGKAPKETRLTDIPNEVRLALEMATNEDIERRAMEGELAMLEEAWKQAEEIAGIADNLLELPGAHPRSDEQRLSEKREARSE